MGGYLFGNVYMCGEKDNGISHFELAHRGYDLPNVDDIDETTAEIIKIG